MEDRQLRSRTSRGPLALLLLPLAAAFAAEPARAEEAPKQEPLVLQIPGLPPITVPAEAPPPEPAAAPPESERNRVHREAVEPLLRAGAGAEELERYEAAVVKLSLDNLRTFPWIAELVAADLLSLHGCRLDIETGQLARLEGDRFVPVA